MRAKIIVHNWANGADCEYRCFYGNGEAFFTNWVARLRGAGWRVSVRGDQAMAVPPDHIPGTEARKVVWLDLYYASC